MKFLKTLILIIGIFLFILGIKYHQNIINNLFKKDEQINKTFNIETFRHSNPFEQLVKIFNRLNKELYNNEDFKELVKFSDEIAERVKPYYKNSKVEDEFVIEVSKFYDEFENRLIHHPYYTYSKYRKDLINKIENYVSKNKIYFDKKNKVITKKELQKLKEEIFIICDKIDEEYKDKK